MKEDWKKERKKETKMLKAPIGGRALFVWRVDKKDYN